MLPKPVGPRTYMDLGPLHIHITSQHYHGQHQLERVHTCDWRLMTRTIFPFLCLEYLCVGWNVMGGRVRVCHKWETTACLEDIT